MKTRVCILFFVLFGLVFFVSCGTTRQEITSTFDKNSEGWRIFGDIYGEVRGPEYVPVSGKKGGNLRFVDNEDERTWYYYAPAKFLNDKSAFFGGSFIYHLKQSPTNDLYDRDEPDIIIASRGMKIVYSFHSPPSFNWTNYSVILDDRTEWRIETLDGAKATNADITKVLSDIGSILIRGEFRNGPDEGGLDNVTFR